MKFEKRYIGLTIFLLGLILLAYMIFVNSNTYKNLKDKKTISLVETGNKLVNKDNKKEDKKDEKELNEMNQGENNEEKNKETDIDNIKNTEKETKKDDLENYQIVDDNEAIETGLNNKLEQDILIVGNISLKLVKDNKYDDIFDLLGLGDLKKYKVDGKNIYIKKLDSVDYEEEKVNIVQLIQKIGGNIAEVNWFGDKQLFVNIKPYYKKESISLVESNGNLYIMVLPYNKYYEYEKVIKDFLFNK